MNFRLNPYLFLILFVGIVYLTGLSNSLFMDDAQLVFNEQTGLIAVKNLSDFWIHATNYSRTWPLSYSTLWLLWPLFGKKYILYKFFNLALHLINSLILYRIIKRVQFPYPLLVGFVFLIHPYHVETICWIFQIKTLLSTFLFLLCYDFFLTFTDKKYIWSKLSFYLFSLFFFLLSLWAKSTAIFMPFIFIFYLRSHYRRWLLVIIPFLALSLWQGSKSWDGVASNPHEMKAKATHIKYTTKERPLESRENPMLSTYLGDFQILFNFTFYFSNFFFPRTNLSTYPQLSTPEKTLNTLFCFGFILFALALLFINREESSRELFAIVFYCFAILPVVGFIYIPYMKFSNVADHWAYLATIPLSMLLISVWNFSVKSVSSRILKIGANLLLLFVVTQFLYNTFTYIHIFNDKNKETAHLLKHNKEVQFIPITK